MRVWHARVLAQQRYYDEAVALLADVSVQDLVDPASLLFYRGISRLKLLQKSAAADDLALLLNNTADVPARFRQMALQVQEEAAKPAGPLGEVAQLMSDVQRRLDLGAADEPVQKREDEVVAALDKLLQDLEEQQKQQQQALDLLKEKRLKEWEEREKALAEREKQFEEAKAKVEKFPKDLEAAIKKAKEEAKEQIRHDILNAPMLDHVELKRLKNQSAVTQGESDALARAEVVQARWPLPATRWVRVFKPVA